MNSRSTNDSSFRYGHFTNSCLEIFDKIPVLEPIESSQVQEVYPSTSLDESSIDLNLKQIEASISILEISTFKSKLDYKREDCLMTL